MLDGLKQPRDLTTLLTRYDAYQELKDIWTDGINLLDKRDPQYVSKAEVLLKQTLTGAVQLIESELDRLSRFSSKVYELGREINNIRTERK